MSSPRSRRADWEAVRLWWPNAHASQFTTAGGLEWHVQVMGDPGAPGLLLLHGTGASVHSFRDLMPALSDRFHVVAPDLPGHGFTATPGHPGLSLPGMAALLHDLKRALDFRPVVAAGHSAGAAILLTIAIDEGEADQSVLGINGALEPMHGNALYAPLARLLFLNPLVPRLFAFRARFGDLSDFLLSKTGSQIDDVGKRCYRTLFQSSKHVSGALGMMANWDLVPLQNTFSRVQCPVTLVAADDDLTVPAAVSRRAAAAIPGARLIGSGHGGHLLHEVDWRGIARLISETQDSGQQAEAV